MFYKCPKCVSFLNKKPFFFINKMCLLLDLDYVELQMMLQLQLHTVLEKKLLESWTQRWYKIY